MDEEIKSKANVFPVGRCKSLLQMVYHPIEKRLYKQVAIHTDKKSKPINNKRKTHSTVSRILLMVTYCVF
ncbi:MAG: hypothetical protein N0A00_06605 [Candidatus Bathyarchaeota archaeon]|nr:hypothetical protein [Candidatus Bathyarchaeota archaeon]